MIDPVVVARNFATRLPPVAATPVLHGHIHDTYIVTCRGGAGANPTERILLQRLNEVVFRDLAALATNRDRITAHLLAKAAAQAVQPMVAELVASRTGASMHADESGAHWRATAFVEDTRVLANDATIDDVRAAAVGFARLTRDLDDLPTPTLVETIPNFHDLPRRRDDLAAAIAADRMDRGHGVADLIGDANRLGDRLERELAAHHADELPRRIAHNDAKLDNVLVDASTGAVACIVDLDTVMAGTALNDFGELARTAATTRPEDEADLTKIAIDRERFRALAQGYLHGAGPFLIESERECLALAGPLLTLENAVRFLTDHLDGDVYFRVHHRDHNAQRARAQLRLAALMLDQLPQLRSVINESAATSTPTSAS
jgi:aminoglycoside phosphotransferase (APT) family kinase protein